jgi:hypothetical protein
MLFKISKDFKPQPKNVFSYKLSNQLSVLLTKALTITIIRTP